MKKLFSWGAALLVLIIMFSTIYAAVQQAQRSEANSPQIQLAQDTATSLDHGDIPPALVYGTVDMAKSLAPFTIIYDKNGQVIIGSGYLDGKVPKAPIGVLTAAKGQEYHTVTWEPRSDVRIAAVTVAVKNYYVLSGRSLKQVEKNETQTLQITLLGLLVSLLLLSTVFILRALSHEVY